VRRALLLPWIIVWLAGSVLWLPVRSAAQPGQAAPGAVPAGGAPDLGARLEYSRDARAADCPDERELRAAVAARLGYPVFEREPASRVVRIEIRSGERGLRADVELRSDRAELLGKRTLDSRGPACDQLASALALAIAMALDPMRALAVAPPPAAADPPPAAPAGPAEAPAAPCPTCPPCVQAESAREPSALDWAFAHVALGPALVAGSVPNATGAAALELGVTLEHAALSVSALADLGASSGAIEAQRTLAMLAVCARDASAAFGWAGCAVGGLGVLRGSRVDGSERDTSRAGSAGIRAYAELRLIEPLWGRVQLDVAASFERTSLAVSGQTAWTTPPFWGALGIAAVAHFL
jgi:hypothetical protein